MKNILTRLAALAIIVAATDPIAVMAVTDKEMEEARAITAMAYLRYANDGSGYLDDLPAPKSMADLKKGLKQKEVENLKSFTAVSTPKDYASWNKEKLVEYWSSTFFKSSGLIEKGKLAKARVRSRVGRMTVSVAAPAAPKPEVKEEPAEIKETQASVSDNKNVSETEPSEETALLNDSLNVVADNLEDAMSREMPEKRSEGHTWVYVMILCILVAVVIGLVIFASNVMKRSSQREDADPAGGGYRPADNADTERRDEESREKFAVALAAKNEEIRNLRVRVETLETENSALHKDAAAYSRQINSLKDEIAELKSRQSAAPGVASSEASQQGHAHPATSARPTSSVPNKDVMVKTIYLGRANSRGLFVRADRKLSIGHSLYRLDTTDGYSGTFRVAEDPTVWEMALLTPRDSLLGACTGKELENSDGYTRIITESSGTAVFEDGCWKVIRKAKIRYE